MSTQVNSFTNTDASEIRYSSTLASSEGIVSHNEHIVSGTYQMGGSGGPYGKENQDAYSINHITIKNGQMVTIVCGCDGHHTYGKVFSSTTVNELPLIIIKHLDDILDDTSLLYGIFETFNETLKVKYGSLSNGGTTVTLLIKFDGCQIVANLADFDVETHIDTDVCNIKLIRDGIPQKVTKNFIKLTEEHSPHSISEVSRVLNLGCEVKYATNSLFITPINAYNVQKINDLKIIERVPHTQQVGFSQMNMSGDIAMYIHNGVYILNLSRSFGDFRSGFIIARPTITIVKYPPGTHSRTILGSDGYFNCLTKKQLHDQLLLEPSKICSNSFSIVDRTFGHAYADNMTIIAIDN